MAKTIFSCGLIDEPDLFGLMDRVPVVCEDFKLGVNASLGKVATIASKYNASPEFVEQVRKALEDLPLIVSMPYKEEAVEMGVETFCPYASEYDSEMQREKYADQEQRWWYTCIKPRPPYPGYHLEDTLISARSLSWMMSEYDVIGNFFWAERVVFTMNATESLNIVLKGLLHPGDHVITTEMEHNSVLRPLYELEEKGVSVTIVDCEKNGTISCEKIKQAIGKNTKAIVCTHASNVTGDGNDIAQIGTLCEKYNLYFILDAS